MTKMTVIWILVCASVFAITRTQLTYTMREQPSACVPMMGLTYNFRTTSSVLCGMLCGEKRAVKYTFNNITNKCILYGEGYAAASSTNTLHLFPSPNSLEDVATGKAASASSLLQSLYLYNPSMAVDNLETDDSTIFHSDMNDLLPWWLLDLGESRMIHEVQILPRRDCCEYRFHDVEIRIGDVQPTNGDFSSFTLFSTYKGPYSSTLGRLSCARSDGLSGRFVVIMKVEVISGSEYLQMADVNVFVQK
ncbi:fucolectin-like [Portunus trituberculatus]|uniref:fucolectin-like n=1 Tax=Portunus trituberculatus TaxID=210409 RepID=UPI001E1CE486|nr:fucolectin-like [Portunus trituberculatus]